jgi:hypothetical protein
MLGCLELALLQLHYYRGVSRRARVVRDHHNRLPELAI